MSGREPKISVIVPVYKVEPYLRKCLDSIVNQTYKNLQIILVDDGSPDDCGAICDEYAARDRRIEVVHQENGGVSAARNAGLKLAVGDYIGWVDSDDWIELDMYAYMLENARKYGADIAVCGMAECYKGKRQKRGWQKIEILNKKQALELLLQNGIMQNSLCDKLWKRELFENVSFPVGKTFEDIAVMHRLFIKAACVVCLPEAKYNYNQKADSIIDNISLANRINHYLAAQERYTEMSEDWPQFVHLLAGQCVAAAVGIWCCYLLNPRAERRKYIGLIQEIAGFAALHYKEALQYMQLGVVGRLVMYLIPYAKWWSFALACCLGKIYKLKHGRNL